MHLHVSPFFYFPIQYSLYTQAWPENRGDWLAWDGPKRGDYAAMATSFDPGRVYLQLRRHEEVAGSLSIFPRWEVCNHEGRHRAWWIKNKEKVPRLEVWVAVDFDADFAGPKRTLCADTDLVVEQGAYTREGKIHKLIPGGTPVCPKLQRGHAGATDELVRTEFHE